MTTANAYAATSATTPLVPVTIDRRDLRPRDVLIDVRYCGVCHSDIHHARAEWHSESYPMVPGHEIAGVVADIGSQVTLHARGDRVGVGCMVGSCGTCPPCRSGEEQYCLNGATFTYGSVDGDGQPTQGGYSTRIVVPENFVLKVPEGIGLDVAAPLLCAGITTYSPLRRWGAGPDTSVAVVGLGGLGHLAVKLARAMGAEVSVLSQSLKKHDDGLRLGAEHFYATGDPGTFKQLAGSFDLIVNTVSAQLDLDNYLSLLALGGALVNVGAPAAPLSLDAFSVMRNRRSFAGSMIGGIRETQEMLDFCAEQRIGADVEVIAAARINEAYERVLASDVRYRFVIDIASMET